MAAEGVRRSLRSRKTSTWFQDQLQCEPVERNIVRIKRHAETYKSQVLKSVSVKIYKNRNGKENILSNENKVQSKPNGTSKKTKVKRRRIVVSTDDENYSDHDSDFVQTKVVSKARSKRSHTSRIKSKSLSDEESDFESSGSKKSQTKAAAKRGSKLKVNISTSGDDKKYRLAKQKKKSNILTEEEAINAALDRFQSSSVPDSLPCRERQFEDIFSFVEQKLISGDGGCMYISGVPGTGKTTTLFEIKRRLEKECEDLPSFKFIEINGVRLGDPKQFYPQLLMELTGQKRTISQALNALNLRFTNGNESKQFTILLVDELDYLRTKTQNLLYNIFDWPTKKNSRLIVLAIANTMDLPERFMLKFSSRIAFTRHSFPPYNFKELEQIVRSRLSDLAHVSVFEDDALQLICRKVAAHSGDARRVLDICRRSTEITIGDEKVQVTMADVSKALQEIFSSLNMAYIRNASIQEKIFLRALISDFRSTGLEEARFIDIYNTHVEICRLEDQFIPTTTELSAVASNLDHSKVILFQKSPSHLYRRVSLLISPDDINFALNLDDVY